MVFRNELRNAINQKMINIKPNIFFNIYIYIYMATNTYQKNSIWNDIQYLKKKTILTSKIQNLTPFLKLYKGMKIIIT